MSTKSSQHHWIMSTGIRRSSSAGSVIALLCQTLMKLSMSTMQRCSRWVWVHFCNHWAWMLRHFFTEWISHSSHRLLPSYTQFLVPAVTLNDLSLVCYHFISWCNMFRYCTKQLLHYASWQEAIGWRHHSLFRLPASYAKHRSMEFCPKSSSLTKSCAKFLLSAQKPAR